MSPRGRSLPVLAPERLAKLHTALEAVRSACDAEVRMRLDPVAFVHAFEAPLDRELAGLLAATFAFGNVTTIRGKLAEVRDRVGPDLVRASSERRGLERRLAGFRHRLYLGEDVAALLAGARAVQRRHGSLEAAFAAARPEVDLARALASFVDELREEARFASSGARRGPAHMLADPRAGGASKRLLLFLRWMVRPADGVDLGLWTGVSPSVLLVPVDVHVHALARNLGLTRASAPSWRVAEEVTAVFRRFDPEDPVKYDFALCHLGMASGCASRFVRETCSGCAIRAVCRHAARRRLEDSTARAVRAKVRPRS